MDRPGRQQGVGRDPEAALKKLAWVAGAAVFGLVVGVLLTLSWGSASQNEELRAQRAELSRLKTELAAREAELARGRQALASEADRIHGKLAEAVGRADALVKAQGTAVEKLKTITAGLRALRDELAAN